MHKIFKFKAFVRDITPKTFVLGRNVMTCCAEDIQFLGYEVINETDTKVKVGDCIYIECSVEIDYSDIAKEEVVMLHAKKITKLKKEKEQVLSM